MIFHPLRAEHGAAHNGYRKLVSNYIKQHNQKLKNQQINYFAGLRLQEEGDNDTPQAWCRIIHIVETDTEDDSRRSGAEPKPDSFLESLKREVEVILVKILPTLYDSGSQTFPEQLPRNDEAEVIYNEL